MKRKLTALSAAFLCLCLLTACGSEPPKESEPAGLPEVSVPDEGQSAEPTGEDISIPSPDSGEDDGTGEVLDECFALLGLDNEAAKDALGGGTENIAADGETLIGCIYSAELFGEETEPSTVYDADGKVSSVSIYLAGAEAGPYAERLTELYGGPDADSAGESTESGSSWEVWKTEHGQIKLLQSYGLCTLEITAPSVGLG